MYNKVAIAPGNELLLGDSGGKLILQPPGQTAGNMSLTDMQNRVWSLLREPGPDSGYPPPTVGDFTASTVQRDLNLALGQFISATGIALSLSERRVDLPVFVVPNGDYPVPADLVSLTQIEYTPAGQNLYELTGLDFSAWRDKFGLVQSPDTGQPYYYRRPYAGYVRLQPIPSLGNAVGPGIGQVGLGGTVLAGQRITITLSNGVTTVTTLPYTVQVTDTFATIAVALATAINVSAAVTGPTAFLAPPTPVQNVINLTAANPPGTSITYYGTISGAGTLTISPVQATNLSPNGDIISFYYTSLGTVMVNPGDTPGIPPQFHMAIVYRVLADYWKIKQDFSQSKDYASEFTAAVREAKGYDLDSDRATSPTIGYDDDDDAGWPQYK